MICLQKRADCIFNKFTECEILRDTKFTRPCPFFKKGYNPVREYEFEGHNGVFRQVERNPKYYISEYGEVVNSKGMIISQHRDSKGRLAVYLSNNGNKSLARVAVLLAEAWIEKREGHIEFLDGDPDNITRYNVVRVKGRKDGKD